MRIIQLGYRKTIDASAQKTWDRVVFDATYQEFFMQAQFYNQEKKYSTFDELLVNVPQADRLHYLTSTAAIGYIRQLQDFIPDVLNGFGKPCLLFKNFTFEILHSHIQNKQEHAIAITFYSEPITWIDTIGEKLLVANGDQRDANGRPITTELIILPSTVNIHSLSYVQAFDY
ncbi:MAG: hypothetical protein QM669_15475 [Siphonobacter sp.]